MKSRIYDILFNTLNTVIMVSVAFLCFYPFYYMFLFSISDPIEAGKGIYLLPAAPTLENYLSIFRIEDIYLAAFISVARTVVGTVVTLFCSCLLGFLVTKAEMPCRKLVYRFVIVTMYLNAGLIPWYITMRFYGLKDNFLLYILPYAVSAFYVVLVKTYIESIPPSFEESAVLDGAGIMTIFARIIFPLSLPIVATIAVFSAVGQWNSWYDNFMLVNNPSLKTLQLTLYEYLSQNMSVIVSSAKMMAQDMSKVKITPMSIRMTISIISIIPIFIVYPSLQKYFIKGIMLGAIKG